MDQPTFLLALGIAGITLIVIVRTIAGAFNKGRTSNAELGEMKEEMEELRHTVTDQAAQLADVQNRLDFAERLLARGRERPALEAGDKEK